MMRTLLTLSAVLFFTGTALAEDEHYDGSDPLLCTVMNARQCDINGCELMDDADVGARKYMRVDFKDKRLTTTEFTDVTLATAIDSITRKDNRLILQGIDEASVEAEDAKAWTLLIADPTGMMTMTVAGEEFATVALGACTPVE
jgi:hypothetical protein